MNKYVYLTILEYPDGVDFSAYSTEKKALKALSQTLEKIIQTEEIEDSPEKIREEFTDHQKTWFTVYGSYGFSVHGYIRKKEIL